MIETRVVFGKVQSGVESKHSNVEEVSSKEANQPP